MLCDAVLCHAVLCYAIAMLCLLACCGLYLNYYCSATVNLRRPIRSVSLTPPPTAMHCHCCWVSLWPPHLLLRTSPPPHLSSQMDWTTLLSGIWTGRPTRLTPPPPVLPCPALSCRASASPMLDRWMLYGIGSNCRTDDVHQRSSRVPGRPSLLLGERRVRVRVAMSSRPDLDDFRCRTATLVRRFYLDYFDYSAAVALRSWLLCCFVVWRCCWLGCSFTPRLALLL